MQILMFRPFCYDSRDSLAQSLVDIEPSGTLTNVTAVFALAPSIKYQGKALARKIEEEYATRLNKKKKKLQSFKLTFILHPLALNPDKRFYYLCGKKTSSVHKEYHTATLSTRSVFANITDEKSKLNQCRQNVHD